MKEFFTLLVFVFLSVVGVYGQQIDTSVGLSIGVNIDNHPAKVWVTFDGAKPRTSYFNYTPEAGKELKTLIEDRVREMASTFSPIPGLEEEPGYGIFGQVDPGPFFQNLFTPRRSGSQWIVPPEALDVKLVYGNLALNIKDINTIELDVEDAKGKRHLSSDSFDGYSDAPCYFGAQQDALQRGVAFVHREYTVPEYQAAIGLKSGRLTLRTSDGYAIFDLLDGSVISYSSPPPAFLTFPAPKLEIVGTADGLEFLVSNVGVRSFIIESSVDFVTWNKYPAVELTSVVGKKSLRAQVLGASRFFRLRVGGSSPAR